MSATSSRLFTLFLCCSLSFVLSGWCCAPPSSAQTLSARNSPCDSPPKVKKALRDLANLTEDEPRVQIRARRLIILQDLLKRYPNDISVHRRYQDVVREDPNTDLASLIKEYRTRLDQQPNDPTFLYLYGRLLSRQNPTEAKAQFEKALQATPDFAWAHLALVNLYQTPPFKDKAQAQTHIKAFLDRCPSNFEAYDYLLRMDDPALLRTNAQRLRALLKKSKDADDVSYYNTLWQLEFRVRPVPEHAQVRQQVEADLDRLRRMKYVKNRKWWLTLSDGYKLTNNKAEKLWAEDQFIARFPNSPTTRMIVQNRWREEHPLPYSNLPAGIEIGKLQAYFEELWRATAEWTRRWPDDALAWQERLQAASIVKEAQPTDIEAIADGLLNALAKSKGETYHIPPVTIQIASAYLKRNVRLERIRDLVQSGFREAEKRYGQEKKVIISSSNEEDSNKMILNFTYMMGWNILLEYYSKTNQWNKARERLAQMKTYLEKNKPDEKTSNMQKTAYNANQATYWNWMGRVAEKDNHKLDALVFYQRAVALRPPLPVALASKMPDPLAEKARGLWKELGGTDEGWKAWLERKDAPPVVTKVEPELSRWEKKDKVLPDFNLPDLQGRTWQLTNLKGKVTFINVWATWCGPCKAELPHVQKLYERLKNRTNAQLITLNIDTDLGAIEPFMKENKYTFPVIPAYAYVDDLLPSGISIPRNWVVDKDGKLLLEQIGFGGTGDDWLQKAEEALKKADGS